MAKYLTTVLDAIYPDGTVQATYAYVDDEENCGVAVEVKRAQEMQREGVEFRVTRAFPGDYEVWYPPDFPPLWPVR